MKTKIQLYSTLLFCVLLFFAGAALHAQVLSLPAAERVRLPEPGAPSEEGLMVDGTAWLSVRRFTDGSGIPIDPDVAGHNYHYEAGTDFVLWRGPRLQVEGMVRMMVLSTQPEGWSDNTWFLDLSAFIVEQNLRVRTQAGPVGLGLGFHHNSKHDVDRPRRRTPIHDTLRLELDTPLFRGTHEWAGAPSASWRAWSRLMAEYALEPVFQVEDDEFFAGGLFLEVFSEPWIFSDNAALFADAAAGLLVNTADNESETDFDWLLRAGLRLGPEPRSVAIFGDVQRLHDDWKANASRGPGRETEPWTLIGFGVSFRR